MTVACRWLWLVGAFLLVTGDLPSSTIRVNSWPTPLPQLAWPWLWLLMMALGAVGLLVSRPMHALRPESGRVLIRPLALLVAAFLLSTLFSRVPSLSLEAFLEVLAILAGGWVFAVLFDDDRVADAIWPALAAAVVFLAWRVIVWRRDESLDVVAFQVFNNAWVGKLQLAWVFNLLAPLMLARFMGARRWGMAVLYALAWSTAGLATYMLFSRVGTVTFVATTVAVGVFHPAYWRRTIVLMVLAGALASGYLARGEHTFRVALSNVFSPDLNPGIEMRLDAWREAVRLFRSRPLTGTGIGTYDEVAYELDNPTAEPVFRRNGWHAHNVYLHLLAETGGIGLAAWCYLWFAVLRRLVGAWRTAAAERRLDIFGVLCAVGAFLLLSMTEVLIAARVTASLRMNLTIVLIVVLGLHAAAAAPSRPEGWIRNGTVH